MSGPSAEERRAMRDVLERGIVEGVKPAEVLALLDALEAAEAVLREVMEDHPWRDELWRFTDEPEATLAALEAPR